MAKDLIIGAASGYDWNDIKYWVNSIRKSKYKDDIAIVSTNMKKSTIDKLTSEGILLALYGKRDDAGNIVPHGSSVDHVDRFFYIWDFLNTTKEEYRFVITTDTRDVIFQGNPSAWLEDNMVMHSLVASSEGMSYESEPWNNMNLLNTFGPFFHNALKKEKINNVGVIAGDFSYVKGLMLMIFQMSVNRPIKIVDQATFNFIINQTPYLEDTFFTTNVNAWAVQLGTTIGAVKAGSGDIGLQYKNNPEYLEKYLKDYDDIQPYVDNNDGSVLMAKDGEPFVIVHQWDRIPLLKSLVDKKYGDV